MDSEENGAEPGGRARGLQPVNFCAFKLFGSTVPGNPHAIDAVGGPAPADRHLHESHHERTKLHGTGSTAP
jgi:hypothetical protein